MFTCIISLVLLLWLPQTGQYCTTHITGSGLALDRASDRDTVSVAACGFAMVNWALLLPKDKALHQINKCITATLKHNPAKNRGWLHHFLDSDGRPKPTSEVSTIDTAIFYAGAKRAAEILDDPKLTRIVDNLIKHVDVEFVRQGKYVGHGFHWVGDTPVFINNVWEDYSEGIIIYKLFKLEYVPRKVRYDLPLFVYYYPLAFFKDGVVEGYLREAVRYQKRTYGWWGVTACDGPNGYQINSPNIISPLSMLTVSCILPELRRDVDALKRDVESPAFDSRSAWVATDRIGIDDMCCVAIMGQVDAP